MPHMSPMQWTTMLMSSWIIMTLMISNMYMNKNEQLPMTQKKTYMLKIKNWNWFQDDWMMVMNCKFMHG